MKLNHVYFLLLKNPGKKTARQARQESDFSGHEPYACGTIVTCQAAARLAIRVERSFNRHEVPEILLLNTLGSLGRIHSHQIADEPKATRLH